MRYKNVAMPQKFIMRESRFVDIKMCLLQNWLCRLVHSEVLSEDFHEREREGGGGGSDALSTDGNQDFPLTTMLRC